MEIKKTTSLCNSCPKLCRFSCPVADADRDESTTPWGKMSVMKLVDDGMLPWDPRTASLAYKCLQCRASETVCELGNPVPETLQRYRIRAFKSGVSPSSVYAFAKLFEDHNNPFPIDLSEKLKSCCPEEIKKPDERIAYFPGCTEIRYSPETIGKTFRLLRGLKIKISLYREPILCCGYPLYAAGDDESFRELAEINIPTLKKYREIWSGTPSCLYTMERLYRELGFKFSTRFFHLSEKLSPLFDGGHRRIPAVPKAGSERIAYHDPCFLGRYRGIYDAPRKIIERITGHPPLEFFRNREGSYCCGAGGLLPITSPGTSEMIARSRLNEFQEIGATTLVTACPGCVQQFRKMDPKLNVMGLIDFIGTT